MRKSNSSSSSGIGACSLLGIVFVTLKLLGITAVAQWSWWWVTLPFWGGYGILLAMAAVGVLLILIAAVRAKSK